jgi:hypothetical protein
MLATVKGVDPSMAARENSAPGHFLVLSRAEAESLHQSLRQGQSLVAATAFALPLEAVPLHWMKPGVLPLTVASAVWAGTGAGRADPGDDSFSALISQILVGAGAEVFPRAWRLFLDQILSSLDDAQVWAGPPGILALFLLGINEDSVNDVAQALAGCHHPRLIFVIGHDTRR